MAKVSTDPKREIHFTKFAVLLVDVLSQRSQMASMSKLPEKREDFPFFLKGARETVGNVIGFRELLQNYVEGFASSASLPTPPGMTPEMLVRAQQLRTSMIQTQSFSDTTLLYMRLPDDVATGMKSLYGLVLGAAFAHAAFLASKVAVRGAIAIGVGTDDAFHEELYGPVLAEAHQIETEVAKYPRIVVSAEFVKYIDLVSGRTAVDVQTQYSAGVAKEIREMIVKDADEQYVLNFLSPKLRAIVDGVPLRWADVVQRARGFALASLRQFQKAKDPKLTGRYEQLLRFFNEHATK